MAKNTGLNFSALAKDANQEKIQIASSFVTRDASASPQLSPLTMTGAIQLITVPDNAAEIIINPSTALNISTESNMASFDTIAAGSKEAIGCARQQIIYVQGTGGTINFRFTTI